MEMYLFLNGEMYMRNDHQEDKLLWTLEYILAESKDFSSLFEGNENEITRLYQ